MSRPTSASAQPGKLTIDTNEPMSASIQPGRTPGTTLNALKSPFQMSTKSSYPTNQNDEELILRSTGVFKKLSLLFMGMESNDVSTTVFDAIIAIINANKTLIQQGYLNLNQPIPDTKGKTCLHFSTLVHKIDIIKTLLSVSVDPNVQDEIGETPLHVAVN
jgi:ankyrin repeat protein